MKEPMSDYGSHPAPQQRIRWVRRLTKFSEIQDDGSPAWELWNITEDFLETMSLELQEKIKQAHLDDEIRKIEIQTTIRY